MQVLSSLSATMHIIEAECDTKSHLLQRTFFVLRRVGRGRKGRMRRKSKVAMEMEINALSMVIHYYPIKTTRERDWMEMQYLLLILLLSDDDPSYKTRMSMMIMMDMVVVGEKVLFGRDLLNYYYYYCAFYLFECTNGPFEGTHGMSDWLNGRWMFGWRVR